MDDPVSFAFFPSPWGTCGIAWTARGVRAVRLPGEPVARMRERFVRDFPSGREEDAPAAPVRRVQDAIAASLEGEPVDLTFADLDLSGIPSFRRGVYEAVRGIPPGGTATYGEIARAIGNPGAARAVGRAMACNPFPPIVPCHRVLAASGLGGFSAPGGLEAKRRLLALEQGSSSDRLRSDGGR
jgi:methylated-DNA-[protein]-cysteine S-methyltransferase